MHKKIQKQGRKSRSVSSRKQLLDNRPLISFTVVFYGGAGGIYFHGESIADNQYISSAMTDKTFSVQQSAGHQIVTVAGSAPANGKITVKIMAGNKIISPAADNVFNKMTFSGFIVYDC